MDYVRFYRGEATTKIGSFTIHDVLRFDDDQMEREHGFVQWIFPNATLSQVQPGAADQPLTEEACFAMMLEPEIWSRIEQAVRKMLRFWGIGWAADGSLLIEDQRRFDWKLRLGGHNTLRMTRLLQFLRLLGENELVYGLQALLAAQCPGSGSLEYWLGV